MDDTIYCVGVEWCGNGKIVRFSYLDKSWRTKQGCQSFIDNSLPVGWAKSKNLSNWQPIKYKRL